MFNGLRGPLGDVLVGMAIISVCVCFKIEMEGSTVVVDLGSGSIKAELSGAEVPRVFQNIVGTVKHHALIPQHHIEGLVDGAVFIGNDVSPHRGLLRLSYPMEHGQIVDWDQQTAVLKYVMTSLGVPTKDHPVVITEPAVSSRVQRNKLAQIIFEELQHPAMVISVQGVLSLYSAGRTTGIVLDVGDGVTHVCPVCEGYTIREAARRADFGGRDITKYLQSLLRQHGVFLDTSAEFEIVRQIKEEKCYVASSKVDDSTDLSAKSRHKLPDGTEITLGNEIVMAPEALFSPSLVGRECAGVVQLVSESLRSTDIDLRRSLYESVFLAGGSTLTNKFCERFLHDLGRLTPRDSRVKIHAPAERLFTAWVGEAF